MGRLKGSKCTEEQRANMRRGQLRRWRSKERREREHQEFMASIAPNAATEPGTAPDMQSIERCKSKAARLRSLEAQATALVEGVIALRRQIQQIAQEVEL